MKRWKCTVCGKIFEGAEPPVPCPVCKAGREAFIELAPPTTRWRCSVCGKIFEGEEPPVPCPVCKAGREAFVKIEAQEDIFCKDTDDAYVIVGAGIAGVEAAKAIRQRNKTARITILSEEKMLPYNRPILSGAIAKGLALEEILLEPRGFYEEHAINLVLGATVSEIKPEEQVVALADGTRMPYTKLLLATGSKPFNPIRNTPESVPVYVLRSYEDADNLMRVADKKRVVLVGGGILGLEAAMALYQRGCHVTIVEFSPRILSLQADEEVSARLQRKFEEMGMVVRTGASVEAADATGAALSDGTHLEADFILASMGVRSEVSLGVQLELEISRGIVVDGQMRTSRPGIWAAGDCAEYDGRVQAVAGAASAMGEVAGASMAGEESVAFTSITPATVFSIGDISLLSVGMLAGGEGETALYQNAATGSYKRLFLNGGLLAGAIFAGENPGAKAVEAVEKSVPLAQALALLNPV